MHWIDPDHLPKTEGTIDSLLLNPRGEVDGLLLKSGLEVHLPPHLTHGSRAALKAGSKVVVYGVRPRDVAMVSAVAFEVDGGPRITDEGPPDKKSRRESSKKPKSTEAEGVIGRLLHGPRGETRGALLKQGPIVRFPPHEAGRFKKLLREGSPLAVRGASVTAHGVTVIEAQALGASTGRLKPMKAHSKP